MSVLDAVGKSFWIVGNIGVTETIRPEEAKHIRYLNICTALIVAVNIGLFVKDFPDEKAPIIGIAQIATAFFCPLVYLFHIWGRYNAARIYIFFLFYAEIFIASPLSGKAIVDHYFIFVAIAYAFLVFPKNEKRWMFAMTSLGVLCYIGILFLYDQVTPTRLLNAIDIAVINQTNLYIIFFAFAIFIISGRYFTDKAEDTLIHERKKLAEMADLLKKMFGRYLSNEVMNSLIENPSALELGGKKQRITIMMTDLRGFTFLSERLEPEQVVEMLNTYFEVMVEVALKYNGTINAIIGDGLLIIFGAPQEMPDRAQRAIACAVEMQNAMEKVNAQNREKGLPELAMGIGLNETDAVVGNIGSSKRSNYSAVGSGVNMTSRIESYTVGGQILVSESVLKEAGDVVRIDVQRDVLPKGFETPMRIYEVGGIAGRFNVALTEKEPYLINLPRQIPLRFAVLDEKDVGYNGFKGSVVRLSKNCAVINLNARFEVMTNLKMNLMDVDEKLSVRDFYGKVMQGSAENENLHRVHFTAVPSEVDAYFQALRQVCGGKETD